MRSGVDVFKDGELLMNQNDPSDVADALIHKGLAKGLFIKTEPDKGWGWDVLPMRFGWYGHFYEIKRAVASG